MPDFNPTQEQLDVINEVVTGEGSLVVEALAGSAKTTTLKMTMERMASEGLLSPGLVCAVAFNKRIQQDLEKALPADVTCKTLNSIGHSAWGKVVGKKLTLDTDKTYNLIGQLFPMEKFDSEVVELRKIIKKGVELAKNQGYVPEGVRKAMQGRSLMTSDEFFELFEEKMEDEEGEAGFSDEVYQGIDKALAEGIRQAFTGVIDFGDQLYMPTMFSGGWTRYPIVLVDEAQDLSELNHIMLRKICSGRLIAVGDSRQAIYAFRGAHSYSMTMLKDQWQAKTLTLTTCFRCPELIVKRVQRLVPSIRPFKPGGEFKNLEYSWKPEDIIPGSAILCRNNAPLIKCAFHLLNHGVSCHILGSDIGKGVIKLAKNLVENAKEKDEFEHLLEVWYTSQPEAKKGKALDKKQSILAALENVDTLSQLVPKLEELFKRAEGTVTLSTGHKCKGFEWDDIYHLNPELIPSKFAHTDDERRQEQNLLYVIETRAKRSLTNINIHTR